MEKGEIPASRTPKPIEKPRPSVMSTRRRVPICLRILDLELLEMITPHFLQHLGESTHRLERCVIPPDGHVMINGG